MLRKIRIVFATIFFIGITLLFLDITGATHAWLGWMAKVQFLPALMALNVGVIAILVVLTLVMGRVYCSVICPLGVMQDIMSWLGGHGKKRRYRFSYSPAMTWLRTTVLVLFVLAIVFGISSFVALLAPYSSYGRIVSNLFSPVYIWVNNLLADIAEHFDSYAFYSREVWIRSASVFAVAALTFVILFVLAWRNGRTYCNTVCPVGTVLGFLSRFSLLKSILIPRNAMPAASVRAAARLPASTARTTLWTTRAAWPASTVSTPAPTEPSATACAGNQRRPFPNLSPIKPIRRAAPS